MRHVCFFLLLFPFLSSMTCQDGVSVIFENGTDRDFKILNVNIRGHNYTFKDLKRGRKTNPIKVTESYRYCYAQAITSKDTLVCQPEDFVGETLYRKGKLLMTFFIFPGEENKEYMGIK